MGLRLGLGGPVRLCAHVLLQDSTSRGQPWASALNKNGCTLPRLLLQGPLNSRGQEPARHPGLCLQQNRRLLPAAREARKVGSNHSL